MRQIDVENIDKEWPEWKKEIETIDSVLLLSPEQIEVDRIERLFPRAKISIWRKNEWNLDEPGLKDFDLIVACNVFMYSKAPKRWFEHVLDRCKFFWMLDHTRAHRMRDRELGDDGDSSRYFFSKKEKPRIENACCLDEFEDRTKKFFNFFVDHEVEGTLDCSFLLFLRGNLKI